MERSFFRKVKAAFSSDPKGSLEKVGVNVKKGGEWYSGKCVLCSDESGSAGYTREGFLKCHQCGQKRDLFKWYSELHGGTDWTACQTIGALLGVDFEVTKARKAKPPAQMTPEHQQLATQKLWEDDAAAPIRKFLTDRKLDDPQMLERFGVGFLGDSLTFSQFWPGGGLRDCYRRYIPGNPSPWSWKGSKGGAVGFWPALPKMPKDAKILLLEGEFDVMTAWFRLRLQDSGWFAVTWTGGANSPIGAGQIPDQWRGREVHICYDNDTFQGADWDKHLAPTPKKHMEMELRRKNLILKIGPSFEANGNPVTLRSIPIDALENFGADFRDWVDAGGRSLDELPSATLKDSAIPESPIQDVSLKEVHNLSGQRVRFTAESCHMESDTIAIPSISKLECKMGELPDCQRCQGATLFPNTLIDWSEHRAHLTEGLRSENFNNFTLRQVVGKPGSCPKAAIIHQEYVSGYRWTAIDESMDALGTELLIISEEQPSLTGKVEVVGEAHMAGKNVAVLAEKVTRLDDIEVDLAPYLEKLMACTPHATNSLDKLKEFMLERAEDLANNVTNIYGRPDIHTAHDLLMHSALKLEVDGHPKRGWLDIAVIGKTRTGKTMVFKHMLEYHGLGEMHTCLNNISRSGLTMGASTSSKDGSKLKAGLFPKLHRRLLLLDEAHNMVARSAEGDSPLADLQQARDTGEVGGVKIYGAKKLQAAVRLGAIGNWANSDRHSYQFGAEHLLWLYGSPESLARLDFGLIVEDDEIEKRKRDVPHVWTRELVRALILRAWSQSPSQIQITEDAWQLAKQLCEDWGEIYSQKIPLFSGPEKALSIMRIAIAVANLSFSHPPGEIYSVEVRRCHVEWAAEWLEHTFELSGYKLFSLQESMHSDISAWWRVDRLLMVKLNLEQAEWALNALPNLCGAFNKSTLNSIIGKEPWIGDHWISAAIREGLVLIDRRGHVASCRLTDPGREILDNLMVLARDFPGEWKRRYQALSAIDKAIAPVGVSASTLPRSQLYDEWEQAEERNEPDNVRNIRDYEADSQ